VPEDGSYAVRAVDVLAQLARAAHPGPSAQTVLETLRLVVSGARLHRYGAGSAEEIVADLGRSLSG